MDDDSVSVEVTVEDNGSENEPETVEETPTVVVVDSGNDDAPDPTEAVLVEAAIEEARDLAALDAAVRALAEEVATLGGRVSSLEVSEVVQAEEIAAVEEVVSEAVEDEDEDQAPDSAKAHPWFRPFAQWRS